VNHDRQDGPNASGKEPSQVLDSRVLGRLFTSAEMRAVFTDRAMIQSWLDAEVGLSAAQAELGLIPETAAAAIAASADAERFDPDALPMIGRTHAQHALPITLGFKFAVLAAECERHLDRLADVRPRVLVGQLGGAVGSLAAFGEHGPEVRRTMMEHLGLGNAVIPWHTARDGFAELTCVAAMIAATCGKIANEVRVLQRTEVAEAGEPFELGKVGSSTMPHKRNPMFSEYVISNAIMCRQAPASMLAAMHQEHERDMGLWGVDWSVLPDTFCRTASALEQVTWIMKGLVVHPDAISRNLHLLGDITLSEAAMMHLAADIGRSEAHEVVYQAAMRAWEAGTTLRDELAAEKTELPAGSLAGLAELLVPEEYLGSCRQLTDDVVARVRARLGEGAE
jgi:adenylosuccinate lyase